MPVSRGYRHDGGSDEGAELDWPGTCIAGVAAVTAEGDGIGAPAAQPGSCMRRKAGVYALGDECLLAIKGPQAARNRGVRPRSFRGQEQDGMYASWWITVVRDDEFHRDIAQDIVSAG